MDLFGLAALVPAIVCILLAVQWGGAQYSWDNGRIIALFVVGFVSLVAFALIESHQGDQAMVPPSAIKRRTIWACSMFSFPLFGSFLVLCYFLPLWFQTIKGDSAIKSGIHNLPSILSCQIFSVIAGGMMFGLGYYTWACILGSALSAVVGVHFSRDSRAMLILEIGCGIAHDPQRRYHVSPMDWLSDPLWRRIWVRPEHTACCSANSSP